MTVTQINNAIEHCPTTWKVEDDHLVYIREDGISIKPSAREIWDSVYGNGSGFSFSPDSVLSEYEFSRFPAEPGLLLTGKSLESIRIDLVGRVGSEYKIINGRETDQLLVAFAP